MTVACHTFRRELAACLRGRSDITSLGWHGHLLACAECRALLEGEQALEALLASLPEPRLPRAQAERVLARLDAVRVGASSETGAPGDRLEVLLGYVPVPAPPPELAARVLSGLAAARRQRTRRFTPALRALAAGLLLAGAAGAWLALARRAAPSAPPVVVQTPPVPAEPTAAPDPELLAALDLLESWELVTDDDLDLLLSSLEALDAALLEDEDGQEAAEDEPPRRNG